MILKKGVPLSADRVTNPASTTQARVLRHHDPLASLFSLWAKGNELPRRPHAIPFRVTVDISISFPIQNKVSLETSRNTSNAQVHANPQRHHVPRPRKSSQTKRNNRPGTNTSGNTARLALKRRPRQETLRFRIPRSIFHPQHNPALNPSTPENEYFHSPLPEITSTHNQTRPIHDRGNSSTSRNPGPRRSRPSNSQQATRSRLRQHRIPRNSPDQRTRRKSRTRKQHSPKNQQSRTPNNPDRLHNRKTALGKTPNTPKTQLRQHQPKQATRGRTRNPGHNRVRRRIRRRQITDLHASKRQHPTSPKRGRTRRKSTLPRHRRNIRPTKNPPDDQSTRPRPGKNTRRNNLQPRLQQRPPNTNSRPRIQNLPRRKSQTPNRRLHNEPLPRRIHRPRITLRTPTKTQQPPTQTTTHSTSA